MKMRRIVSVESSKKSGLANRLVGILRLAAIGVLLVSDLSDNSTDAFVCWTRFLPKRKRACFSTSLNAFSSINAPCMWVSPGDIGA